MSTYNKLSDSQLLEILALSADPIAIYIGEDIIIQSANNAMLKAWGRDKQVIGKSLIDALPEISNQPFFGMLQKVWHTGIDDIGKAIKADLFVDEKLSTYYFDYSYLAIKNSDGNVYAIMHTAKDVTEKVLSLEVLQKAREKEEAFLREQALNEELATSNEALHNAQEHLHKLNVDLEDRVQIRTAALTKSESRLRYLLADAPIAIAVFTSEELIIESANKKVLEAWGKTAEIIGKPLGMALPELVGQSFLPILKEVFRSGEPYFGNEIKALLEQNGKIEEVYCNFVYQPIKDEKGNTSSIMLTANLVTEQVLARHNIQQLNEELSVINEELSESQEKLLAMNRDLKASETRLDQILSELPTPVVVLLGENQVVSNPNNSILQFWKKTREEVVGKPMLSIFPELAEQPFPKIWKQVYETGDKVIRREKPVYFNNADTGRQLYYVDYYYQPLHDLDGNRIGILATVIDVTDKLEARKMVEQAETKLRFAIDSSQLGTWYIDTQTREFIPSLRLKQIFGFYESEEMDFTAATKLITEEYLDIVVEAVNNAMYKGDKFDMEYTITTLHDRKIKWIRATGKLYEADGSRTANFSGTIQDITERKLEEQRKDDFLSIASHELKTPITSLKGSLQLLNKFRENLSNPIVPKLVDQANGSVVKITNLIDDLLNTTRTNEGQLHLNKTKFSISEMLDTCCNHVRMGGKHDLIVQGDNDLQILADEARIDQVVVNLVNNAAKYAPHSRAIYLIIETLADQVKISIKDNGPGIAAEKIPHLFDRYYRADYSGTQYSGLGLGLYISSEIIKRHGGSIGVDSELGKGSTFWFTIPIS
ncbi:PAS domain-containing sensor histidine kinase [Pedobacter mucosus]|uniref:PAS domain-containing sensor histidine kinase n=1 Tax=Pedobacter mucosus TaxID=2895286 RepID=UPI001EE3BA07|nr:PAS domain-containing sensor histidine kinase [Pedobacter mucosus]UKT65258.1 PAS domain-containing protein [Pedobacter mucosus]